MRGRAEWRAALSMLGTMSGMGLATGREPALYFAQLRDAALPGILAASALFGLIAGGMIWRGNISRNGARLARICEFLRLLLASLVAAIMLARLGKVGAMTLPLRHGYVFGMLIGMLSALTLAGMKDRWPLGLIITTCVGVFCAANAMDPRPARVFAYTFTEFELAGSIPIAMLLAFVYAALNACVAEWGTVKVPQGTVRPAGLGIRAAALLFAMLCLANLALLRGGDAIIVHPMPWVVLSARWGLMGFWLCAGLQALCAAATLSAALTVLIGRLCAGPHHRMPVLCAMAVGAILLGILSSEQI